MGFGAPLIWTALSLLFVALPKPAANCDGGLDCVGGVKAEAAQARTTMMRVMIGLCCLFVAALCRLQAGTLSSAQLDGCFSLPACSVTRAQKCLPQWLGRANCGEHGCKKCACSRLILA